MPKLAKVHVKGEVHVFLREVTNAEDVEADPHRDGDAAVVGPHSPVVANLEGVKDVWDVDSWESSTSGSGDDTLSLGKHWKRPEKGEEGQKKTLCRDTLCHGDKMLRVCNVHYKVASKFCLEYPQGNRSCNTHFFR